MIPVSMTAIDFRNLVVLFHLGCRDRVEVVAADSSSS